MAPHGQGLGDAARRGHGGAPATRVHSAGGVCLSTETAASERIPVWRFVLRSAVTVSGEHLRRSNGWALNSDHIVDVLSPHPCDTEKASAPRAHGVLDLWVDLEESIRLLVPPQGSEQGSAVP